MAHSLTKIWIHGTFATHNREQLIIEPIEKAIHNKIRNIIINDLKCPLKIINGMPDHVHILFQINTSVTIEDIFKMVKGSSSHWINHGDLIKNKFAWQTGYAAFSVSESQIQIVEQYIFNQKEHHKKFNFQQEYEGFLKNHGLLLPENR